MKEFDFEQLKNIDIEFPDSWVENALKVPSEKKKPKPVMFYRYAAATAAVIVLISAIGFTMMFGFNRNLNLTDPDSKPQGDSIIAGSTVDTTGDSDDQTETPAKNSGDSGDTQKGTVITTEPNESVAGAVNNSTQKQQGATQSNAKNNSAQVQKNGSTNTPSNGENQAEAPSDVTENADPTEEPKTDNDPEPTIYDFRSRQQGQFGAAGDHKPRPSETEAYGCHFVTSVSRSAAQGNTYYCRVEDGSGNILGSGAAQKYDWGNPNWPLDLQYTADFVLTYGATYTVTFFGSNGVTVWSGSVYLKEHQTDYLLY